MSNLQTTPSDERVYWRTADTAKYIRGILAREFPGQTFSVRSKEYAGGSSITVRWTDGPTPSEVESEVKWLAGKGFDGMIDMSYYHEHWLLPDGTIAYAGTNGTEDSGGTKSKQKNDKPHPKAKRLSVGVGYIFCERERSPILMQKCLDEYIAKWGPVEATVIGKAPFASIQCSNYDVQDECYRIGRDISLYVRPAKKENATAPAATAENKPEVPAELASSLYYQGTWTWLRYPQNVSDNLKAALESLGFSWGERRKQWYAKDVVTDFSALLAAQ